MENIGIALILLLAVVVSGTLARLSPVAVPLPLVQIALGAAIAGVTGSRVELEPHFFFLLFLPPLLFLDGWRIPSGKQDGTQPLSFQFGDFEGFIKNYKM